jgi:hypothetical protein
MRPIFSIGALIAVLATTAPAEAARRDPKAPNSGGVKVTTSGNQVRYTVNRKGRPAAPGTVRSTPPPVRCSRWSTFEVVAVDGVRTTVEHRWRQCFSTVTGRPTGPAREIGLDGAGPVEEVWTAEVPDPVLQRQNGVRFVTQRAAWVWLPPAYFRGIRVDLRSNTGEVRAGGATARATQVIVGPGFGGAASALDCTAEAQFPYDTARPFWDQLSCPLWYMKSSLDEPGGVYRATATVVWSVDAVIDGEPADTATVVTDSSTAIRVEELQALVTCVGGSSASCPSGNEPRR